MCVDSLVNFWRNATIDKNSSMSALMAPFDVRDASKVKQITERPSNNGKLLYMVIPKLSDGCSHCVVAVEL